MENRTESTDQSVQCHVHDNVSRQLVDYIRSYVCRDLMLYEHTDGQQYCLLHLPTQGKDHEVFERIINERCLETDEAVTPFEAEYEDKEQLQEAIRSAGIYYDFRYVWFPASLYFNSATFSADANFSWATFSADVSFISTTFSGNASFFSATFLDSGFLSSAFFSSAIFSADANFLQATFSADAFFSSAQFSNDANFCSATFSNNAFFESTAFSNNALFFYVQFSNRAVFKSAKFCADAYFNAGTFSAKTNFDSVKFLGSADFSSATFSGETSFHKAKFSKVSSTIFDEAKFNGDTFFDRARFRNHTSFNSAIFEENSDVFFRGAFVNQKIDFNYSTAYGLLRFGDMRQGDGSQLDFHEAVFEKASRIGFHTIWLHPNWFINVDSRKFVFNNIEWKNCEANIDGLKKEHELTMEDRYSSAEAYKLLVVSYRHLAANAEENNRLGEASRFRRCGFALERMSRIDRRRNWWKDLNSVFGKKIFCKNFFYSVKPAFYELLEVLRRTPYDMVHFGYHWASNYGESWLRAALVLVGIWLVFGMFYWLFGSFEGRELNIFSGLGYSSSVMLFQKTDYQPTTNLTFTVRMLQMIATPIQAALLALAIRRKFMR